MNWKKKNQNTGRSYIFLKKGTSSFLNACIRYSISSGQVFTWENLNYHVPVPGGQRRLLHDVFGYVKPASLTALMGASGAGKTTCLDVLAQRKNIGVVSGDVLVGGRPLQADFARGTAYGLSFKLQLLFCVWFLKSVFFFSLF